ncbi:MAG: integration host factor subunit beta [Legionellales bacterium]|nr:MAG: integration host factor subunit beta [Legionellales bacterium]
MHHFIRSDLVKALATEFHDLPLLTLNAIVKQIISETALALQQGDRVELRGFGIFTPKNYPAGSARNPKTGVTVAIPARRSAHFKMSKELQEKLNKIPADATSD